MSDEPTLSSSSHHRPRPSLVARSTLSSSSSPRSTTLSQSWAGVLTPRPSSSTGSSATPGAPPGSSSPLTWSRSSFFFFLLTVPSSGLRAGSSASSRALASTTSPLRPSAPLLSPPITKRLKDHHLRCYFTVKRNIRKEYSWVGSFVGSFSPQSQLRDSSYNASRCHNQEGNEIVYFNETSLNRAARGPVTTIIPATAHLSLHSGQFASENGSCWKYWKKKILSL